MEDLKSEQGQVSRIRLRFYQESGPDSPDGGSLTKVASVVPPLPPSGICQKDFYFETSDVSTS